jgi:hypothetical protein
MIVVLIAFLAGLTTTARQDGTIEGVNGAHGTAAEQSMASPTACRVFTYRLHELPLPASSHPEHRLAAAWNAVVSKGKSCMDRGFEGRRMQTGSTFNGTEGASAPPLFDVGQWEFGCVVGRQLQTRLWHATKDPNEADVFFVPWFGAEAYHRPHPDRSALTFFASTLRRQLHWWARNNGSNHLFFSRFPNQGGLFDFDSHDSTVIGHASASDLDLSFRVRNAMGFTEHFNQGGFHAVPHPSWVMPEPGNELRPHRAAVDTTLAALVHGNRTYGMKVSTQVRRSLHTQCARSSQCKLISIQPSVNARGAAILQDDIMRAYRTSTFCLNPSGDNPLRKAVVDSIAMGCIPVVFHTRTLGLYDWHLSSDEVNIPL